MIVTPESPWRYTPRCTLETFERLLRERGNPTILQERDAVWYWGYIVGEGVDPLYLLAVFNHESSMGTAGVARTTHSWGNTREPTFGDVPKISSPDNPGRYWSALGRTPGASGEFPIFRDWLDGLKSTVARLLEPTWYYHDRPSIREIYDHPSGTVWAPAGDGNDPTSYLGAIMHFMNRYADADAAAWTPPPIRVAYIPVTNANRPGGGIRATKIVWHDTGNPGVGANAEAHRRFTHEGGGKDQVSFHFVVDEHEIVQLLPVFKEQFGVNTEKAHHALSPCNFESLGIELCVNSDGDFGRMLQNAAWLGAKLEYELGIQHDIQHFDCTRKNCPASLRNAGRWDEFTTLLVVMYDDYFRTPNPQPEPQPQPVPDVPESLRKAVEYPNGKWVPMAFDKHHRAFGGLRAYGLPVSGMIVDDGRYTQFFERAVLRYFPENQGDDRVQGDLLGAAELARRYPAGIP